MKKVKDLSEFLTVTAGRQLTVFYRGESSDYGITACVATANRNFSNYDMYSKRMDFFDRRIRESSLLGKSEPLIPFAQHSGLATKLLDITSNSLVALYFACQKSINDSDGFVYIFDDFADATDLLEKYPDFDLEDELIKHLEMLQEQEREFLSKIPFSDPGISPEEEISIKKKYIQKYSAVKHDELEVFGKCINEYRNKYTLGNYFKGSRVRRISQEDSLFMEKSKTLSSVIEGIKKWVFQNLSNDEHMEEFFLPFLPIDYKENTPAIDFVHPYKEKRYDYYNEQYKSFDVEVREYLISLECLVAFINDMSPFGNLAITTTIDNLKIDFLPNLLYRPVMTFKRGLSQQSAFFVQTVFDKHKVDFIDPDTHEIDHTTPRQLMKSLANYSEKIVIDVNSKEGILEELDKIGVNKTTMFGDADNIAAYAMEMIVDRD